VLRFEPLPQSSEESYFQHPSRGTSEPVLASALEPARFKTPKGLSAIGLERLVQVAVSTRSPERELRRAQARRGRLVTARPSCDLLASSIPKDQPGSKSADLTTNLNLSGDQTDAVPKDFAFSILRRDRGLLSRSTSSSGNPRVPPSSIRRCSNAVGFTSDPKILSPSNEQVNRSNYQSRQASSPEGPSTCTTANLNINHTETRFQSWPCGSESLLASRNLGRRKPRKTYSIRDSEEPLNLAQERDLQAQPSVLSGPEEPSISKFELSSLAQSLQRAASG
jgi:hypothetical protein